MTFNNKYILIMAEVIEAESAETTYNDIENIADIFDSVVKLHAQNEEARRAQIEALRVFDIAANMYSVLINRINLYIIFFHLCAHMNN